MYAFVFIRKCWVEERTFLLRKICLCTGTRVWGGVKVGGGVGGLEVWLYFQCVKFGLYNVVLSLVRVCIIMGSFYE